MMIGSHSLLSGGQPCRPLVAPAYSGFVQAGQASITTSIQMVISDISSLYPIESGMAESRGSSYVGGVQV